MDQRNLILAIVLSVSILLGFQVFIEGPRIEEQRALQEAQKTEGAAQGVNPAIPGRSVVPIPGQPPSQSVVPTPGAVPPGAGAPVAGQPVAPNSISRAALVGGEPRIKITTDRAIGSIRLKGGLIDDLTVPARPRWPLDPAAEKARGAGVKA